MSAATLRTAPPETWGRRFQRCRKDAIPSSQHVEELLDGYVSGSALGRIEKMTGPPADRRTRQKATTVLVLAGYDPTNFGLSLADLPSYFTTERLAELRSSRFGWIYELAEPAYELAEAV
jgi:hypothetical protein